MATRPQFVATRLQQSLQGSGDGRLGQKVAGSLAE